MNTNPEDNQDKGFDFNGLVAPVEFVTSVGKRQFTKIGMYKGCAVAIFISRVVALMPSGIRCDAVAIKTQCRGNDEVIAGLFNPICQHITKAARVNTYSTALGGYYVGHNDTQLALHGAKSINDAVDQILAHLADEFEPVVNTEGVKQFWVDKLYPNNPFEYRTVRKPPMFGTHTGEFMMEGFKMAFPEKVTEWEAAKKQAEAEDEQNNEGDLADNSGDEHIAKESLTDTMAGVDVVSSDSGAQDLSKVVLTPEQVEGLKQMGEDIPQMAKDNEAGLDGLHAASAPHVD